jgi:hypothetical protein
VSERLPEPPGQPRLDANAPVEAADGAPAATPRPGGWTAPLPDATPEENRLRAWLVIVPFTFPMWLAARRRDPALAERTRWFVVLNVVQSIIFLMACGLMVFTVTVLPGIVDSLARRAFGL